MHLLRYRGLEADSAPTSHLFRSANVRVMTLTVIRARIRSVGHSTWALTNIIREERLKTEGIRLKEEKEQGLSLC